MLPFLHISTCTWVEERAIMNITAANYIDDGEAQDPRKWRDAHTRTHNVHRYM